MSIISAPLPVTVAYVNNAVEYKPFEVHIPALFVSKYVMALINFSNKFNPRDGAQLRTALTELGFFSNLERHSNFLRFTKAYLHYTEYLVNITQAVVIDVLDFLTSTGYLFQGDTTFANLDLNLTTWSYTIHAYTTNPDVENATDNVDTGPSTEMVAAY